MPSGSNASSGGGAPSGSAGGSLTGTYPNPTIATIPSGATATTQSAADGSTKVATTAYVDTADALKANLAGPTFTGVVTLPTGTVATTQSASDNSTKLGTTAYIDTADALKANLASPTFSGTPSLPTGTTATTQASTVSNTTIATTAYAKNYTDAATNSWYCSAYLPQLATSSTAVANANDYRWARVTMAKTGTLHDVYVMINTTGGNGNIGVLDDGQANATHTTRTITAIKGSTATPAGGTWFGFDPALSVSAGDTLAFFFTFDGTTAKVQSLPSGGTGTGSLPTTSFFPGSGASTSNQKLSGTILAANLTASVNSTVTEANFGVGLVAPMFVWRIT